MYYSKNWKTFPDFLFSFLPTIMGKEWANQELKKGINERHPVMQWYDGVCRLQKEFIKESGNVSSMPFNGVAYCYFGLSYSLYLLNHNVELQEIYLKRLRDTNNFQGAYYELMIANCLIRAGFKLELEDEQDESSKHCEYSATSIKTQEKYWIEAKARSVDGVLGKRVENSRKAKDPTHNLSKHVREALEKPADSKRFIFVDLNAPGESEDGFGWVERAGKKLDMKEKDLKENESAYVFVTNMNFHHHLGSEKGNRAILAHGLGINDFGKTGHFRLSEVYRQKQKHIDAFNVMEAFQDYPKMPSTFDGGLPSQSFGKPDNSIKIGERYLFSDVGESGLEATVTTATVMENEKKMYIGTDSGHILTMHMTDDQIADYKAHKDVYFGTVHRQGRKSKDLYDFFENMVEIHLSYGRESMNNKIKSFPDVDELMKLNDQDLVLEYCERLCASMPQRQGDSSK